MIMQGSAAWRGTFKDGKGTFSTESGALSNYPYDVASRFGLGDASNPEELIAAAHAACFSMAFSKILQDSFLTADQIDTTADVTLEQVGDGFEITAVHLIMKAKIPGATQQAFRACAEKAKRLCPVSKLFKAAISLDACLMT